MTAHRDTSRDGHVLLDIGDGAGALVVRAAPSMALRELTITPFGATPDGTHAQIHPRPAAGGLVHAAVFPVLAPGRYTVRDAVGGGVRHATVVAARVTEIDWP